MNGCSVEGCLKPHWAKGYCSPHYHRFKRHGDPLAGTTSMRSADDTFEEIDWFLQFGIHPAMIANALQRSPLSIAKLCYRYGRDEWAAMFTNAA